MYDANVNSNGMLRVETETKANNPYKDQMSLPIEFEDDV